MLPPKRILVPTDFSKTSEQALQYAVELAEAFGSQLHLLHVVEEPFVHGWTTEGYVAAVVGFRDELQQRALQGLGDCLSAPQRDKFRVRLATRIGSPALEISRYAKDESISLIVMGTHGRGPIAHMLLGSVAEKVVRSAPCPVLTVRQLQ
jgi:nucleotide-binding universal stress UspA family protein